MKTIYHKILRILTDVLGVLLIIGAVAFGWLPGIGGVPMFLAGLGLLAINHEWAKRWLVYAKDKGVNLADKIFADNPTAKLRNDAISIVSISVAAYLLITWDSYIGRTLAFAMLTLSLAFFLGNRQRLQRIMKIIKK